MSSPPLPLPGSCRNCSASYLPGARVCSQCHALLHSEELEKLSAQAKALEELSDWSQARQVWVKIVELLPDDSRQATWVRDHLQRLEVIASSAAASRSTPNRDWARKFGPLAPIALVLAKGKFLLTLFNLKFFFSLAAFMGVYWSLFGAKFGVGFAVLILCHEMGHYIDIKRRGLPAEMPVFLPGLGAYVKWQAMGVSTETRAAVSLAGPLAGWVASAFCLLMWWQTGSALWAALARASAWLNALNLIPVWVLDGGQAILALGKNERLILLSTCLALWFLVGESVFFLVAAGVCWRLFTKDLPTQNSGVITAYFVSVLACLGFVMWLVPGKGFGSH